MFPHPSPVVRVLGRAGRLIGSVARSWAGGFAPALVLVGAGTATAATGGLLTLGHANSANKSTILNNTGKGPALQLGTKSAKTPNLQVSNSARIKRLNADQLDGIDSSALQKRVWDECPNGQAIASVNANGSVVCADFSATTQVFSVDGTYTVPPWVSYLRVEVWGGGGTGQESNDGGNDGGAGGGAGGYLEKLIPVGAGSTCSVKVGLGGTWTTDVPDGGATTVTCGGSSVTAPGGSGGNFATNAGGAGGDPGPYGVPGGAGEAGTAGGQAGAPGLQTGGGDLGGMAGNGGPGAGPLQGSSAGAPGLAVIHVS